MVTAANETCPPELTVHLLLNDVHKLFGNVGMMERKREESFSFFFSISFFFLLELKVACLRFQRASSPATRRSRCTSRFSCLGVAASSWTAGRVARLKKSPSSLTASPWPLKFHLRWVSNLLSSAFCWLFLLERRLNVWNCKMMVHISEHLWDLLKGPCWMMSVKVVVVKNQGALTGVLFILFSFYLCVLQLRYKC